MNTAPLPWTHHRKVSGLYLVTVTVFALAALLAFAVARLEHFVPGARFMNARFFGQLLGLHRILLQHFVLVPAIPAILGLGLMPRAMKVREIAFPRLALASWWLFAAGGALVFWSFAWAGIEPGWSHAVVSAETMARPSLAMLTGLLLGCLAAQAVAVNLIVTVHEGGLRKAPLFAQALYGASWMQALVAPIHVCALSLAMLQRMPATRVLDVASGGDATLLALLAAFASAPLSPMIVLASIGATAAALLPEPVLPRARVRRMGGWIGAMAVLGLLAVDARALPGVVSTRLGFLGSFHKALWLIPTFALLAPLIEAALVGAGSWRAARVYAIGALLLMLLAAPLDVFLGLPAASFWASGYLASASDYLLVAGGCLLALLAVLSHEHEGRAPAREALGVVAAIVVWLGFMTTVLPMVLLGMNGLSMELATYPASMLPLQVLVAAGGTILAAGLLLSVIALPGTPTAMPAAG